MRKQKRFTALGANIFAGLFTKGVQAAGFDVLGHLEHGPYGVATAKLNYPDLDIRVGRQNWREKEFKGKVDFMYTNPPCAAWSTARAGQGGSWEDQTARLRCVHDCVEAGIEVKPKAWCWESVTQAWSLGQPFVMHQAEKWNDAGYHVTVLLQDNQYLGAPQIRKRMFLIAHQHPLVFPDLLQPYTVERALAELKRMKDPEQEYNKLVMPPLWSGRLWPMSKRYGGYFAHTLQHEGRGPKNLQGRRPSSMVRRLKLEDPAPVMMAAELRLHPTENRFLNWKEWLHLCGLPMDWKSSQRSLTGASMELGRAVLPPVGKWLATAVKNGLHLPRLDPTRPVTRLVDLRKPDAPLEKELFVFQGFTLPPIVPPEHPPLPEKKVRQASSASPSGPRPLGSGARIREMILKGWDADKILPIIHKEFPGSKASKADVSWNRGKLRKEGKL